MNFFSSVIFLIYAFRLITGVNTSSVDKAELITLFDEANPTFMSNIDGNFCDQSLSDSEEGSDTDFISDEDRFYFYNHDEGIADIELGIDDSDEESQVSQESGITVEEDITNVFAPRASDAIVTNATHVDCHEIAIEAAVVIFYNIWYDCPLFPLVKKYLSLPMSITFEYLNPGRAFLPIPHLFLTERGFDIHAPQFIQFCNYLRMYGLPITSPLSDNDGISPRQIWDEKRILLINVAARKIRLCIDSFNNTRMYKLFLARCDVPREYYDVLVENVKDSISEFLLSDDRYDRNFTDELEDRIKSSIEETALILGIQNETLSEHLTEQFLNRFKSALDLIYNYNDPEDFSVPMDIYYPIYY